MGSSSEGAVEIQGAEGPVYELDESESKHELVGNEINEVAAERVEQELEGEDGGRLEHLHDLGIGQRL